MLFLIPFYVLRMKSNTQKVTLFVMLLSGLISLLQFLLNRSLWWDEALLALNICSRDSLQLLNPLNDNQVAPIAFLQIEKAVSCLLPHSEMGLRLFPLTCFWASVYLFYKITCVLLKDQKVVLLAVSVFCLNSSLIYYSSEVKQYMTDVFVCLLLYHLLLRKYRAPRNKIILLTVGGGFSIFLSNIAPVVLFIIALCIIAAFIREEGKKKISSLLPLLAWMLTFVYYYYTFIHNHPSRNSMLIYWSNSFMPANLLERNFWDFCFYKTRMVFFELLPFHGAGIFAVLFFSIGLMGLLQARSFRLLILLLGPVVMQLLLSLIKLYPFDLRLILYQTALYTILLAIGINDVQIRLRKKYKKEWITAILAFFPLVLVMNICFNFPFETEELKKSMAFMSAHIRPDETIYLYYGAVPAFRYYTQSHKINFKNRVVFGNCYRGAPQKYLDEISKIKQDHWILFSHLFDSESKSICNFLDSASEKRFGSVYKGSEVYLYAAHSK